MYGVGGVKVNPYAKPTWYGPQYHTDAAGEEKTLGVL